MRLAISIGFSLLALPWFQADANAQQWHRDLSAAWTSSQQSSRPLMVFVTMDGCGYCKKMVKETFRDVGIKQDLMNGFVTAVIDSRRDAAAVRHFKVRTFPAIIMISPSGKTLDRIDGFVPASTFRSRLRAAYGRELALRQTPVGR